MTAPHDLARSCHTGGPLVAGPSTEQTVRNIIKVDHAGEHGAIGIYLGQIFASRLINRSLVRELEDILQHEREHFRIFDKHLRARGVRKCKVFFLWRVGGVVLGVLTGMLGKSAIGTCTSAVETVVVNHLQQQITYLRGIDHELMSDIEAILTEELAHKELGEELTKQNISARILAPAIRTSTEAAIWASMRL